MQEKATAPEVIQGLGVRGSKFGLTIQEAAVFQGSRFW